jgi:hypothetical protein
MILIGKMQMMEYRFRVEKCGYVMPLEQVAFDDERKKGSGLGYAVVRVRHPKSGGGEQF